MDFGTARVTETYALPPCQLFHRKECRKLYIDSKKHIYGAKTSTETFLLRVNNEVSSRELPALLLRNKDGDLEKITLG
jgi:hypothetical protein